MAKLLLKKGLSPDNDTIFSDRLSVIFSQYKPEKPASGTLWVNYNINTNAFIEKMYYSNTLLGNIINTVGFACAWIPIENGGNISLNLLNNNSSLVKFSTIGIRNVQVCQNGVYQEYETELYYENIWYK